MIYDDDDDDTDVVFLNFDTSQYCKFWCFIDDT